jgi:hypothetical protein
LRTTISNRCYYDPILFAYLIAVISYLATIFYAIYAIYVDDRYIIRSSTYKYCTNITNQHNHIISISILKQLSSLDQILRISLARAFGNMLNKRTYPSKREVFMRAEDSNDFRTNAARSTLLAVEPRRRPSPSLAETSELKGVLDNLLQTAPPVSDRGTAPDMTALMAKYGITRAGYSVNGAFEIIPCGQTKGYDLIRKGKLKIVKLGKRTIVLGYSIALLLDELEREGSSLGPSPNPKALRKPPARPPLLDEVGTGHGGDGDDEEEDEEDEQDDKGTPQEPPLFDWRSEKL